MFDKQELAQLGQLLHTLKGDIREETRALISASEHRMITHMDARFCEYHKKIVGDIGEIIDNAILPQIADLQHEVVIIKRHIKLA